MQDVLIAAGPRPEIAELALFAPLIGEWALVVENIGADGSVQVTDAEWHFGWALDGRAVVDVWLSPARDTRLRAGADGEWGMTVRFFDPRIGAFRSTWHGPARGWVIPFRGAATADGLVLDALRDDVRVRWVFSALTAEGFDWRAEESAPGESELRVRQRFRARRVR